MKNFFALLLCLCFADALSQTNAIQSAHRQINATATTTASTPLGSNDSRKYLQVQNQDATLILWACGGCTAVASGGAVVINPGQTWAPLSPPTGAISIISNGTNSNVGITEGR